MRRCRPPTIQEPQVPAPAGTTTLPKRPQALSGNEMDRLLSEATRTKRRRLVPHADVVVASMQKSCQFPPYLLELLAGTRIAGLECTGRRLARHCSRCCCPQRIISHSGSHYHCWCGWGSRCSLGSWCSPGGRCNPESRCQCDPGRQWKLHLECRQGHWHSRSSRQVRWWWWWRQCNGMPGFALFTAVEADKFKENLNLPVQCTSSGRRVQSSRERQENDIMEEVVTWRRLVGRQQWPELCGGWRLSKG